MTHAESATPESGGAPEDAVAAQWRLTLINHWSLGVAGQPTDANRGIQRLTAFLALEGPQDRGYLAGALWPNGSARQAHGSLRSTLWRIRRRHPGLITTRGGTVGLGPWVDVDVDDVRRCAREVLDEGRVPPASTGVLLRGDLLPGWYDDWVLAHREQLRQFRLHALESLAERLTAMGRHLEGLQAALAAVRLEPLRESAHRAVARIHLAEGNIGEAARQFRQCRRLLTAEFGIGPTRQFLDLMRPVIDVDG